jgi:putative Holliday junction resolvase
VSVRVLAIDLGTRRIGVALSDGTGTLASPLCVLERTGDRAGEHRTIEAMVLEHEVERVLVGLPTSLSGDEGPAARTARVEIAELAASLSVPVEPVDERFTTVEAHKLLTAAGRTSRERRGTVDAAAAAVMLQAWLDAQRPERPS